MDKFFAGIGFGFDVVDGELVLNEAEQKIIKKMRKMIGNGKSLTEVHRWLNNDQGISLAYSSMRVALMKNLEEV